jgi:hypothetical protein
MTTEHWYELRITDHPKKMSETLADYARPLTDQLPDDHTAEELKATMMFAACVWNVVDVGHIRDAVAYLSRKMPPRLRVREAKALAIVRRMLTRKNELFGEDHRLAMDIDVYREGGELRVKAVGLGPNPDFWNPKAKA